MRGRNIKTHTYCYCLSTFTNTYSQYSSSIRVDILTSRGCSHFITYPFRAMKIRGSFPSQKVMSFVALATFMTHIFFPLFAIESAFADGGAITFTDDISNTAVQSDTVTITGS